MRILVVEDQPELSKLIKERLETECFAVDAADDGQKGLFLGSTNEYDLIILDNNLPKKTGPEVCQELRKNGKTTPILILSVESDIPRKVELLDSGADDYMTKPFSFDELIARVRAMLRRPSALTKEVLTIDDLVVDTKKHLVRRGKKDIYLTKKEFMLLEYLMKNEGNVVCRASIMEHVWDMNRDLFSNTIETHILTLRKKVDTEEKRKLIHTVPGRGYKICIKK